MLQPKEEWIQTDFNGILESGLLCLSHDKIVKNMGGEEIELRAGMVVTAFDSDTDESGNPDNIIASGVVEPSPENAVCSGSIWSLRIDGTGITWESEIAKNT